MRITRTQNALWLIIAVAGVLAFAAFGAYALAAATPDKPADTPAAKTADKPPEAPPEKPPEKPPVVTPPGKTEGEPAPPEEGPKLTYKPDGKSLTAVDAEGKTKWSKTFDSEIVNIVAGQGALFIITKKDVTCLTPLTGQQRWIARITDVTKIEPLEDTAIITAATQIAVFNMDSGKELWHFRPNETIKGYTILDDKYMIITTDKRVAAYDYYGGDQIANVAIPQKDNFTESYAFGPIIVLRFEQEMRLWNAAQKKELPQIKSSALDQIAQTDLPKAVGDLEDKVTATKEDDRIAGLVLALFARDKAGGLVMSAALQSKEEAVNKSAKNILSAMAEYSHAKGNSIAAATTGILESFAALDTSGLIEKSYFTAYYTKYAYELPDPYQTLNSLVSLLRLGDKQTRESAIRNLESLTNRSFKFDPAGTLRERDKAIERWQKWLNDNQTRFAWDIENRKIKITK
jgi:hypothetical protein